MLLRSRRSGWMFGSVALMVALTLLVRSPLSDTSAPRTVEAAGGGVPVTVYGFYDLPRADANSHDISGLAWDDATNTLWGIRDRANAIISLRPSADFRTWSFGPGLTVDIGSEMWDGEGIVRTERGFFITNEVGPHLYELDPQGRVIAEALLPDHFGRIRANLALEALTLSPDGRYLFTANEQALEGDGDVATLDAGTTVRIVRYDRQTNALVEYAYRTDPVFARPIGEGTGDRGLVDMAALSPSEVLVMERSFVPGVGNNVRIYRVGTAGAADVQRIDNLGPSTPVLAKTLLVDLADLPDDAFPVPLQPQPNKILDNFEGMALGPRLPDGRRLLFLVSDDNSRDTQTPRLLVLAVAGL